MEKTINNCEVCKRKDCMFFDNKRYRNNCTALSSVYIFDKDCKFFKERYEK